MASTWSQTDICNMALMQIGISQTITSLDDGSTEAKACSQFFDLCRQTCLHDFPWNFAVVRATLASTANTPPTNWSYQYALPADALRILTVTVPGLLAPRNDQRIPFEVASDGTQGVLNCNADTVELLYVQDVTDYTRWPADALNALALLLGSKVAMPLSIVPALAQAAAEGYKQAVLDAAADSMSEGFEGPQPDSEFIAVRQLGWPIGPWSNNPYAIYPSGFSVE